MREKKTYQKQVILWNKGKDLLCAQGQRKRTFTFAPDSTGWNLSSWFMSEELPEGSLERAVIGPCAEKHGLPWALHARLRGALSPGGPRGAQGPSRAVPRGHASLCRTVARGLAPPGLRF